MDCPGGRGSGTSAKGHPSDREPLLGPPAARARSLLPLPLEGKAKRSHSFDMGDFAAAATGGVAPGGYSPPTEGLEHLDKAQPLCKWHLCSGTGSPALGLCSP